MERLLTRFVVGLAAYCAFAVIIHGHGAPDWFQIGGGTIYAALVMDWWDRESR